MVIYIVVLKWCTVTQTASLRLLPIPLSRYLLQDVGYQNWILASISPLINHRINFWKIIPWNFVDNNIFLGKFYAVFFQLGESSYLSWRWRWKIHPKLSSSFSWLHTVLSHYTIILTVYNSEHVRPLRNIHALPYITLSVVECRWASEERFEGHREYSRKISWTTSGIYPLLLCSIFGITLHVDARCL